MFKLVPFGYRPGISRILTAVYLNIKIPLIFIKFCPVKLLIIYFGFCRVKLRVTRVSGAVRALYSLPGGLYNKLSRMALGFQNSLYFVKNIIYFIFRVSGVRFAYLIFTGQSP